MRLDEEVRIHHKFDIATYLLSEKKEKNSKLLEPGISATAKTLRVSPFEDKNPKTRNIKRLPQHQPKMGQ